MENKRLDLLFKLSTEQVKYTASLLQQPPEEILRHAYEYTVRENIVACVEEIELTDGQLAALLAMPSPMDAIYNEFGRRDAPQVEVVRDSIRSCADNALCRGET